MAIGQELLNVPMGDMIRQMASAIAEGQMKLDASSIEVAEMMGGLKVIYDEQGKFAFDDSRIFFGYDLMTVGEAEAFIAADNAVSGGKLSELSEVVENQKKAAIKSLEEEIKAKKKPSGELTEDEKKEAVKGAVSAIIRVPTRMSMLELGFTPTFYQFVDTIIEVKIAIKITQSSEYSRTDKTSTTYNNRNTGSRLGWSFLGGRFGTNTNSQVTTSQVDATYASKYSYSAEGSSLLRTKLVPLPPPPVLEERIRRQLDEDVERRRRLLDEKLSKPAAGGA